MEENQVKKLNFFKKIWYSIVKFEKYPDMAAEGVMSAIKYLVILVAIVSFFIVIGSTVDMYKMVGELSTYIESNIPEFSYENGKITMETELPIVIEDIKYSGIDKIVINPFAETEEEKNKSKEENKIIGTEIFFFKDQIILKNETENNQVTEQPYTYQDFISSYVQENIEKFNKADLVEYLVSKNMYSYYLNYALSLIVYLFIVNILVALIDTLELSVLGWITTILIRMRMRFTAVYNMSIYAFTLSMILNIVYIIINYFTDFTISYFQIAYILIAYVYLAATIFIIKDDFIKKQQEVERIKQEQEKVREEIKEQEREKKEENPETKKKKKKEDTDKKEKDNEQGGEPNGSEA